MSMVPPANELRSRLKRFRRLMAEEKLGAMLVTDGKNVRYLSGFTGDDSALLITQKRKALLTDFRYVEEAQHTAKGWRVVVKPGGLMEKAVAVTKKERVRTLGLEMHNINLSDMKELRRHARGLKLKPQTGMAANLRLTKSPWEVKQIEKALRIQEKAFNEVCALLKPGMKEYEAAAELRYRMVRAGADDQAFDCMFQWGTNSSLPHGRPTGRKLKKNSIILIDWGARYGGYHADLTRTFFIGRIPPRLRHIHETVMEAQARAIKAIAPGAPIAEVDQAARDVITRAGFGKQFGHGTGHGLGLYIHEGPGVNSRAQGPLIPGMVVTVEPGIYVPGLGGVRIEDDVLVTERGCRVLSRVPKGLRWTGENK